MSSDPAACPADELPSIPCSIDLFTDPWPITITGRVAAFLERIQLQAPSRNLTSNKEEALGAGNETRRGRSASPIRANIKRRRSVASAPGDALRRSPARENVPAASIEKSSPCIFHSIIPRTPSPSVGTQRIKIPDQKDTLHDEFIERMTPYSEDTGSPKRRKADNYEKESTRPTTRRSESATELVITTKEVGKSGGSAVLQLPLSGNIVCNGTGKETTYERKGAFRLKERKANNQFRIPKPRSQPVSPWRAGDGFSGDEAKPDFLFILTGTHRQAPRSLSGIGKLELESESAGKYTQRGSRLSRPKGKHLTQYEMKCRRGVAQDIWPTRENFTEELGARKRKTTVPGKEKYTSPTTSPRPIASSKGRETFSYVAPVARKRKHSHFENFGRYPQNDSRSSPGSEPDTQSSQNKNLYQPEWVNDSLYDSPNECEVEGDPESLYSSHGDNELSENEQHHTGPEVDSLQESQNRESSARNSAVFISEGEEDEFEGAELVSSRFWN